MTFTRRRTLALIGGGTVFAASSTAAGFLTTRTPNDAIRPWTLAGAYDDPRLNALSFALLAPNPHNLQPWQVALEGDDALRLYLHPDKRLPQTDPYNRQIIIGMGCFLEQMVLAAGAAGQGIELTLYPDGPDGAIAHARMYSGGQTDPLAEHILARRSCKQPFAAQVPDEATLAKLAGYGDFYSDPQDAAALRALTWEAWMVEALTRRTMQESVDLMRFGKAEINANPDGIALGGPFLESLMLAGILTLEDQADPESQGFQAGMRMYRDILHATPAYVALTTAGNSREDQIEAGRRWLRLNLATTALGLSLHPVSQALQEYPEMDRHRVAAHALLAPEGHTVQMLGRLGYGPHIRRTPRWPLEAKLIDG